MLVHVNFVKFSSGEKYILNLINTTLESKQATQQVLIILEQPWHVY